jgi:hypothetical protein
MQNFANRQYIQRPLGLKGLKYTQVSKEIHRGPLNDPKPLKTIYSVFSFKYFGNTWDPDVFKFFVSFSI